MDSATVGTHTAPPSLKIWRNVCEQFRRVVNEKHHLFFCGTDCVGWSALFGKTPLFFC